MNKFNFPLVTAVDGEARASSEVIAYGLGQQHASVIKLVRKHQSSFEEFGSLRFEIRVKRADRRGGEPTEYAMLNEHQASLLISFMRNSPKVIEFKVALIREFFRMRDSLKLREQSLWKQMQELVAREVESKVKASFGSHLMLDRKREIPLLESERKRIELEIQPSLLN
ncbi:Rha family transcriptional regulator [Azonexus sp. IMCC34839]|uniref:Rha family transcriptional regulator n=1 Tax=Azonexus sp. IMCC34839 TaxID=3133695 RepID=UPI00399C3A79